MTRPSRNFKFSIQQEIFAKLPGLKVFVAVVRGVDPIKIDKAGCSQLLATEWTSCRALMSTYPNVQSHPYLAQWRKAYASLGIPSKKYTTSIENLCKRALKPDSSPRSINPLVDLYNACSLKFVVPFGGFDMSEPSINDLEFRFTVEGDTFHSLDGDKAEPLAPGEAAYASSTIVLTRHINWKQSREGLISDDSKDIVFMAEILGDVSESLISEMSEYFSTHCEKLLNISPEIHIVTEANPAITY